MAQEVAGDADANCSKKPRVDSGIEMSGAGSVLSEFLTTSAGVQMPRMIYGTAWKKERTEELVKLAVSAGFRGVDTAGQPKHYFEAGVGAALRSLLAAGHDRRGLFIQTKVNKNYAEELNPDAPIGKQVDLAIANSLSNLGLEYVDSLVLHSPYKTHEDTMEAWRAMERSVHSGHARQLGVSNVKSLRQLRDIHRDATLKPAVVQQRFYAETGFEREMREWCAGASLHFQSFWTLTANSKKGRPGRDAVVSGTMRGLATKYAVTPQVLFFSYVMRLGVVPLTGTCNETHMKEDLASRHVPLTEEDAKKIGELLADAQSSSSY